MHNSYKNVPCPKVSKIQLTIEIIIMDMSHLISQRQEVQGQC